MTTLPANILAGTQESCQVQGPARSAKLLSVIVLVLGLLGGLVEGLLGLEVISVATSPEEDYAVKSATKALARRPDEAGILTVDQAQEILSLHDRNFWGGHLLLAGIALSFAGGVLAWQGQRWLDGGLMVVAVLSPAIFLPRTLTFTAFLLVAALIAFLDKRSRGSPAQPGLALPLA